jgi:hypothetical protein
VAAFQPRRKARTAQTASVTGSAYLSLSLTVTRCTLVGPLPGQCASASSTTSTSRPNPTWVERRAFPRCGDAAGARDPLAILLQVRERVLGPDHARTLATRHELARWTGEAGDAAGARDLLAALLPVRERVSGPEHPETQLARHQFAYWTERAERGPSKV